MSHISDYYVVKLREFVHILKQTNDVVKAHQESGLSSQDVFYLGGIITGDDGIDQHIKDLAVEAMELETKHWGSIW